MNEMNQIKNDLIETQLKNFELDTQHKINQIVADWQKKYSALEKTNINQKQNIGVLEN